MTVRGDLAAGLTSRGMTNEQARDLLKFIFEQAKAPDFAIRYAREQEPATDDARNDLMCDYWQVIDFLLWTI